MTTDVKYFNSQMLGAPQISGTKGSLLSVLDACMVTGFNLKTANSVTVASGVATVVLPSGNFDVFSIVLVSGATPVGLNGEKRVIALPGASTFTFDATGVADGVATGTITVKTASLGWLKPFTGTNKAAFKIDPSLHPDTAGRFVRVLDTGNYCANIMGYESMTTVDAGAARFPTAVQQTMWVNRSASTDPTEYRKWFVVGDSRFVYVGVSGNSSDIYQGPVWFCFGEFKSTKSADPYRFIVTGNYEADQYVNGGQYSITGCANDLYVWLTRSHTGLGASIAGVNKTWPFFYDASGNGPLPYPNEPDNAVYLNKIQIFEKANNCYRGEYPGMRSLPHQAFGQICADKYTPYFDDSVPGFTGRRLGFFPCDSSALPWGVVAFDLTGPWEH